MATPPIYQPDWIPAIKREIIGEFEKYSPMMLPPERFSGAGVYGIYLASDSSHPLYRDLAGTDQPIYVGKAMASGSRKGISVSDNSGPSLVTRLREHRRTIAAAEDLPVGDFRCRALVVAPELVTVAEAALIENYSPVWNAVVDGFGCHQVGSRRSGGARSQWDTLHPGREWAQAQPSGESDRAELQAIAAEYVAAQMRGRV